MRNIVLFQYQNKNTCIHKLPAPIKCIFLIVFSLLITQNNTMIFFVLLPILVLISIAAKLPFAMIKKNTQLGGYYFLFIFIFKIIGQPVSLNAFYAHGIEALLVTKNILCILFAASVFYSTTSRSEIFELLQSIENIFAKKKKNKIGFVLIFALTLNFIPQVFFCWNQISSAWTARTRYHSGVWLKLKKPLILLPILITELLEFAVQTERALQNRRGLF
ncbi:CbiQ family ECF transporter T component [Treponema phagedenis]|uniref:CbiQ family ECF transporter T component n=1 Tax=Treponema phagedenis TaxID=162 RepID=UPI0001F63F79|nr:CbiQ family ECF transporter T component [Treponema phagedenis]EFW37328.1 cobalt transport protein [Treponema phagedenis F0421]TYT79182.1 hypothetical protein FS559_08755 [Treponema phagedenis]